ncbi:DNA-binding NarL/FixJ family response regulator [Streptomyces achromogenes]|nr:DNA-binding NarL/FixJ family response regulator [Streptomyces achromogenes]
MPGLSERHRRSSTGLTDWLRSIAIELGGPPAARLCRRLRLAGKTRLLRLLTAPTVSDRAPRVLGADEFVFRKGCTYGTVLVDVEAGRVVDVLPDRTSETFAAWLKSHPGAEIICRDRATAYTKAVREAGPKALEVADRRHLLQNLSAAVEKTCHQHRDCLRKRAEEKTVTEVPEPPPMLLPPAELPRTQIIERTRHRYEDIHRLLEKGWTISAIARRLNLDRKTCAASATPTSTSCSPPPASAAPTASWSRSRGAVTLLSGRCLMVRRSVVEPSFGLYSGRGGKAGDAGDLLPDCEADGHLGSVGGSGHQVAAGPEVGRDAAERGQEPLGPAH